MTLREARITFSRATLVGLGLLVAIITQALVFPVIGLQIMLWQQLTLSAVLIAVARFLRSWFRAAKVASRHDPGGEG